jgi:hypothetical protein
MKKYLFTSLLAVYVFGCFSQNIKAVTVIPSNPTSTNNIKIFTHVEFTSNAISVSSTTTQAGNVINLNRCYSLGFLTIMDQVKDTLHLGTLAPGVYTVNYNGAITNSNTTCSSPAQTFTSSLTFTVLSTPSGIHEKVIDEVQVSAYPNPFQNEVWIDLKNNSESFGVKVYDCLGNLVYEEKNHFSSERIDLSNLTDGTYSFEVISKNSVAKRIIIMKF